MYENYFELKEEHIILLSNAYIEYDDSCETGGPAVNCKRPYGNSDVAIDVARILGKWDEEYYDEKEEEWSNEIEHEMITWHYETATALQIILKNRTFKPGLYILEGYGNDWRKANKKEKSKYEKRN